MKCSLNYTKCVWRINIFPGSKLSKDILLTFAVSAPPKKLFQNYTLMAKGLKLYPKPLHTPYTSAHYDEGLVTGSCSRHYCSALQVGYGSIMGCGLSARGHQLMLRDGMK